MEGVGLEIHKKNSQHTVQNTECRIQNAAAVKLMYIKHNMSFFSSNMKIINGALNTWVIA
jgi:hypothetical protein